MLAEIDRDLRVRLVGACNLAVQRAIERSGARLRSKAGPLRDVLRHVPSIAAAATVGPALVAEAGFTIEDLLAEAFAQMESTYRVWAQQGIDDALGLTAGFLGEFTTGTKASLAERWAINVADSQQFLVDGLTKIAGEAIYADPNLVLAGDLVPTGFVRQVLAVAGGTADVEAQGHAYVALTNAGTAPVGGLVTGPTMGDVLAEEGFGQEGFVWVYGPAPRKSPFAPHLALDGVEFANFDDPVLANDAGWPPFAYYMPGDHDYCRCDFEPIILAPTGDVTRGPIAEEPGDA